MTDQERDPEASGPEDATDPEPEADETELAGTDETELTDDLAPGDVVEDDEGEAAESIATTRAAAGTPRARGSAPRVGPAPTAADEAVHVQDRVSGWFVIVTVGVFVVIMLWSLLLGRNGFVTDVLATPKPIATPIATVIPSVGPSGDPSVAPSVSPSVAPASPDASASPAAS